MLVPHEVVHEDRKRIPQACEHISFQEACLVGGKVFVGNSLIQSRKSAINKFQH